MQKVAYRGWPNCYRLANERIEVIATTDVGPRIIHLSLPGGENMFGVMPDQAGLTGGDERRIYGGHRLWHAPEAKPRSYYPDNAPVLAEVEGDTLRLIPPEETTTGIQKEMVISLVGDHPHVRVRHVLENRGLWPVELAPWALSVMNLNGVAIVPQSTWSEPDGLLPNRVLTLWPYTDLRDPRVYWGTRCIMLRQDPQVAPQTSKPATLRMVRSRSASTTPMAGPPTGVTVSSSSSASNTTSWGSIPTTVARSRLMPAAPSWSWRRWGR